MRQNKLRLTRSGILAVLALALMMSAGAVAASKYKVLHRFEAKDGAPYASVILDQAGNLYGTTAGNGSGVVFNYRPKEAENKYYLSRWAERYFDRNRYTIQRDFRNSLYSSLLGTCGLVLLPVVERSAGHISS